MKYPKWLLDKIDGSDTEVMINLDRVDYLSPYGNDGTTVSMSGKELHIATDFETIKKLYAEYMEERTQADRLLQLFITASRNEKDHDRFKVSSMTHQNQFKCVFLIARH